MSIELDVRLPRIAALDELLVSSERCLAGLLRMDEVPELRARPISESSALTGLALGPGTGVSFSLGERHPVAFLVGFRVPASSAGDAQTWVAISLAGAGGPLERAVVAAIAIALAGLVGSEIVDDGLMWSDQAEILPEDLRKVLTLPNRCDDLEEAAKAFVRRLPYERNEG